ncbi:armadillo repeat-containing protein [Vairimorpha necatrix]|uniref:Armadillo repeat-containing protein n=1 Tax=Vairimorpha necatrix TaxID=6039 RepID=A0AAX4JBQ0_9MICR
MTELTTDKLKEYCENFDYKKLSIYCTRDIKKMPQILHFIKNIESTNISEILNFAFNFHEENLNFEMKLILLQTCLYTLLSNPFNFIEIMDKKQRNEIFKFVTENCIKEKLTIKIIVKIFDIKYILENTNYNSYIVLKELSKIQKLHKNIIEFVCSSLLVYENLCEKTINRIENLNLHEKDFLINYLTKDELSMSDRIYSFKILSHQYKHHKDLITPSIFFKYLNFNNFKFGYSLSRSFLRIIKYFDVIEISNHIQSLLTDIFANEMLWINSFHILGSLFFKNYKIEIDLSIIKRSVFYSCDDTNYRSCLVREYALFLIYSIIRRNPTDELINILVYTCIFDMNLKIRRISASILSSYFNLDLFIKRYDDLLDSYEKINRIFNIEIGEYLSMNSTDITVMQLKNEIIMKYDYQVRVEDNDNVTLSYINLGYNFKYSIMYEREFLESEKYLLLDLSSLFKYRFFDNLCNLYIEILSLICSSAQYKDLIETKEVTNNIIFMLSKNLKNFELVNIIWSIDSEVIFEFLFKNRKKSNHNIIVANIRNYKYLETIILEYKKAIKLNMNIDFITSIYKSLLYYKEDIRHFEDEILMGLENYSITSRGDVCYEIRLTSLLLVKYDKVLFNKYLVRYLVDKSKYIRDYLFNNLEDYKYLIDGYEILSKRDIKLIIRNMHLFDEFNVTIGILGYLATCDKHEYEEIIDILISKRDLIDKNIKKITSSGYSRVYNYIIKLDLEMSNKFKWTELIKKNDTENTYN